MDLLKISCSVFAAATLASSAYCDPLAKKQDQGDIVLVEGANVFCQTQGRFAGYTKAGAVAYLKGDFLYLVPNEGGLEYAFSQASPEPLGVTLDLATIPTVENGHFDRIGSKWLPGFRAEAGMHLPLDDWYAYAKWTRIVGNMSGSTSISSLATANISAIWLGGGFGSNGYEQALQASGTWNLHYNVANLALVRRYFSSSMLVLSVHSGLQGASINQQFHADYSGGTIVNIPTYFKGKNNFQAIGLFGECDMGWCIAKDWRILGNLSGSVNYGRYKLRQQVLAAIHDTIFSIPYGFHDILNQTENRTRFAYEANLGLEWSYSSKGGVNLTLNAMYNLIEWLDLNQLRRFIFSDGFEDRYFYSANGNLSFQGISASLGVGY